MNLWNYLVNGHWKCRWHYSNDKNPNGRPFSMYRACRICCRTQRYAQCGGIIAGDTGKPMHWYEDIK